MGALDFTKTEEKTQQAVSPLKDPFSKDCIASINISIYGKASGMSFMAPVQATVSFKNGDTKGSQNFSGTELPIVAAKVQAFIDSLK